MKTTAKKLRALVALVTVMGLLAACGSGGSADAQKGDGTLLFGAQLSPGVFDPDLLPVKQMTVYVAPMYDAVVYLDPDRKLVPMLAEKWESGSDDKGDFLRMELRKGVKFPDGTPFTAETVRLNIERSQTLEKSTTAGALAGVEVETEGDTTVVFRNEDGVGALLGLLAGPPGMMISDKAIKEKSDLNETPAGIGPFSLDRKQPNRVVYTANADYWDQEAVKSDRLEVVHMADDAKLNAIRSGELDATLIPDRNIKLAEDSGYEVIETTGIENELFAINTSLKPFDDIDVRKAVNIALDREAICKGVFEGHCAPVGQLFGVGNSGHDPELGLDAVEHDLDEARKLIESAGATGTKVEIATLAGVASRMQLATVLQQQMNKIGLSATVTPVAPSEIISRFVANKEVPVALGSTGNAYDPIEDIERYALPSGPYNPGGNESDEVVKLYEQARREGDVEARNRIYQKISAAAIREYQFIPFSSPKPSFAVKKSVEGWKNPWAPNFPSFRGVGG